MKKLTAVFCCFVLLGSYVLAGCGKTDNGASSSASQSDSGASTSSDNRGSSVTDAILESYSAKNFAEGEIPSEQLELILQCGMKAPSARNLQPWRFSVITKGELVSSIVKDAPSGAAAIIVSGSTEDLEGVNADFDCGLAAQNIYMAAQSLGLGAHLYTGPIRQINEEQAKYGIPVGYQATAVVLICQVKDREDAIASASPRNSLNDIVNYVE